MFVIYLFFSVLGNQGKIVHCENLENMNIERNKTVLAWLVKFHREVLEFLKDSMDAIYFAYVQVKKSVGVKLLFYWKIRFWIVGL